MSNGEHSGGQARIQISAPQSFTISRQLICSAYGLLLFLPTLILAILAVSLVQLGVLTLLVPFLALLLATFFLPFGFGNAYIARLAEPLRPPQPDAMLVQIALVPRLHYGFLGMLEDADDIGWLSCTERELLFQGDAVKLSIPLTHVQAIRRTTSFRSLFLYWRTVVSVSRLDDFTELRFAERSSLVLPTSWKISRHLYDSVASKIPTVTGNASEQRK